MMPMRVAPPPVQAARRTLAPAWVPAATETVRKVIRPMPPPPSRLDPRPTVKDRWGHFTGLGAETDRVVVQEPEMDLVTPVICGLVGYLLIGALVR